jgi:hypothetical protein
MFEVNLKEGSRKKRLKNDKDETLAQPMPVPISTLTEIPANNSVWRWYRGNFDRTQWVLKI